MDELPGPAPVDAFDTQTTAQEHAEPAPPPPPPREFDDGHDIPAELGQAFVERARATARQAAMDPDDGVDLGGGGR